MIAVSVLFALLLAARASMTERPATEPSRARPLPFSPAWQMLVWLCFAPSAVGLARLSLSGAWMASLPLGVALLAVFSWPVARAVGVPLGLVEISYFLTLVGDLAWRPDREGGAALAAAWALGRSGDRDPVRGQWVAEKIDLAPSLKGAGVLAGAMLAAARGDPKTAKELCESVGWMSDAALPFRAKAMARRWLCAELAARGEWKTLAARESVGLLTLAARRIAGCERPPTDAELWRAFLWEGRWWATWALMERALAARDVLENTNESMVLRSRLPTVEAQGLTRALTLHAVLVKLPVRAFSGADLGVVVRAWDEALSEAALQSWVTRRALELRAPVASRALSDLRQRVSADLSGLALGARVGLGELAGEGEIARKVAWQLRDVLLAEVEAALEALKVRVDAKRAQPKLEEWREFVALRGAYDRAARAGGLELRRLAFAAMHRAVCSWAVWLFNERKERAMGNAMFQWMLDEAGLVGDTRTEELQRKNVACGV